MFVGEKILIPNAEVYQNVVCVQTAYGPKRSTLSVGLGGPTHRPSHRPENHDPLPTADPLGHGGDLES